jgi:hypothetical protein
LVSPLSFKQFRGLLLRFTLVSTLRKKYEKASIGLKDTGDAYHELSAALDSKLVESWRKGEEKAQVERGEALRIYNIQLEQGIKFTHIRNDFFTLLFLQHCHRLTSVWL